MKNLTLILTQALLTTVAAFAQEIPKKEFTISVSEKNISIQPGETKTYDVTLNRSRSFSKTKISLSIGSSLPEGLTISFTDGVNPMVNKVMTVQSSENVKISSKAIILNAKSSRANKGVMLNLNINDQVYTAN